MAEEKKTYQELVEREIALLNALSEALLAARTAIVSCKLGDLQETINEQKRLCGMMVSNTSEIRRNYPLAAVNRQNEALACGLRQKWQQARLKLQQLNKEHIALLHRSRRTVNAVLNGFRSFEGDYATAALQQTAKGAALRERA